MASFPQNTDPRSPDEDGFATVAAIGVCLALSLTMTAVVLHSGLSLSAAQAAYDRSRAEYALDAQEVVLANALSLNPSAIDRTPTPSEGGASVLIEREAPKLSLAATSALPAGWVQALGIKDPPALMAGLASLEASKRPVTMAMIAAADPSLLWARCAEEGLSPLGAAKPGSADMAANPAGLPVVVRLMTRSVGGWQDDRIVRLTSDPANRAVVLDRRFTRIHGPVQACPAAPKVSG